MSRHGASVLRGPFRASLAALALLAFAAHALIPSGFMPGAVHGHSQLIVCSGMAPGSANHIHHGNSGPGSATPCSFALGGGPAPLPADFAVVAVTVATLLTVSFLERAVPSEAPPRHTAPRGPPTLA
jgi:hypothetical protein